MKAAPKHRRRIAAAALAALLAALLAFVAFGSGDGGSTPTGTTRVADPTTEDSVDNGSDADEVPTDPKFDQAGKKAERELSVSDDDDAWAVPDAVSMPLNRLWNEKKGVYVSPGGRVSTRLNAELLRLHAAAAVAGHKGSARHDNRVRRIVAYLTGPAYIDSSEGEKFGSSRHNSIHVPGWRQSSSEVVNQHPSIDATVARGLRMAWLARANVKLSGKARDAIRKDVVAVASSKAFRNPERLLNQINWNADLYAAAATVSNDDTLLKNDYRAQLQWFVDHAHEPTVEGGRPNLSSGNGFFYQPEADSQTVLNRSDTVEYASIVMGALRYYDEAVRAGMKPLSDDDQKTLTAWVSHTLEADWTASGYLNWETGKAGSRLHLRQYWALALDGVANGLLGSAGMTKRDPTEGDRVVSRGEELFRRWSSGAGTVLLPATSFNYPSRFVGVRNNRTTASVRLGATIAEWAADCRCRGRLAAPASAKAPVLTRFDPEFKRLTVNGPRYSTALSPTAIPTGGGLEPAWLLDANADSLIALGGGGQGSLGLRLVGDGKVLLDTQPGPTQVGALALRQAKKDPNAYTGRAALGDTVVRVTHRFLPDRIITTYLVDPRRDVEVQLRLPSAGRSGTVRCGPGVLGLPKRGRLPGCGRGQDYVVRSAGGASMHVGLLGLTPGGIITRSRPGVRSTLPRPGSQATIRIRVNSRTQITRVIRPDAD
ncbi:hypothetical protein [Patulibacter minatonensis]|uniref:hypothetical protein n=1 Tax=Patulibacter minatonensis TaxID=298163 RepID=UPI00047E6AA5|nr:hypothetical protein [Patulibacter minatonensis]